MARHDDEQELNLKVARRRSALEAARQRIANSRDPGTGRRARDVDDALAVLESHLDGVWNASGRESLFLFSWLDSTAFLVEPVDVAAPGG